MKKRNLFLLSILIVVALLPKVVSIIANNNSPFGLNFYTFSSIISNMLYILIFVNSFKFILMEEKNADSFLKKLYNISIILICNALLIVITELIKAINFYKMAFEDLKYNEFINLISTNVFTETGVLGYLTMSFSFFLLIHVYRGKLDAKA